MTTLHQVPSEGQIIKEIRRLLFPAGISCPRCRRRYDYKLGTRYFCKKCRLKFSLKRMTPFAHSKLSFQRLWLLLYCFLKRLSLQDAQSMTGLSAPTIRRWYRRFAQLIPVETASLASIVEVDEAFIGRQRYHNQTIVVGAVERSTGRIAVACIPDRETGSLDRFILRHISPGSMVCTDAYGGYESLTEFFGYGHQVVNHSMGHFGLTNRIENVWMRLRRFIRKVYHHVWKEHLPRLLKEFQARINHPQAFQTPLSFLNFVFQVS